MTEKRDVAASVRARLNNLAKARGDDVQLVLTRYANERLLARLAVSPHARMFVLKGAALFTVWTGHPHRATRDMDFLGFGTPTPEHLANVVRDLASMSVDDDGVRFDSESIQSALIREEQEYGGVRVTLNAYLGKARISLQLDVGFGDAITPAAVDVEFPALLAPHGPRLKAYPRESVVAEKVEAMVQLGLGNSRMKDFYDLVQLGQLFEFDGSIIVAAMRATFGRRGTVLPVETPVALTAVFVDDKQKQTQWNAFVGKARIVDAPGLAATMAAVVAFVGPPLEAARGSGEWPWRWQRGGPWQPK